MGVHITGSYMSSIVSLQQFGCVHVSGCEQVCVCAHVSRVGV